MEKEFQEWLAQKNAGWYLLSEKQMEWYLNQWIDELDEKRKEQKEHEEMV